MPFFCTGGEENADWDAFRAVAEGLKRPLDEVQIRPLSGNMLYDAVQKKKPTAGCLDGWGWREFKALPVVWFDRLASILTLVEEDGIWLDGMLDAYIAMSMKGDADSTPLGQRPLCYFQLLIGFGHLLGYSIFMGWFESWVPESVFSAGGGRSSVEAWYSIALDLEAVGCSGFGCPHYCGRCGKIL